MTMFDRIYAVDFDLEDYAIDYSELKQLSSNIVCVSTTDVPKRSSWKGDHSTFKLCCLYITIIEQCINDGIKSVLITGNIINLSDIADVTDWYDYEITYFNARSFILCGDGLKKLYHLLLAFDLPVVDKLSSLKHKDIKLSEKACVRKRHSKIAVITTFYNYSKSKNRYNNLLKFADHIAGQGLDLWVIEGVSDTVYNVNAHRLIITQVYSNLWMKEVLLNYVARILPKEYTMIAWIDADVIFSDGLADRIKVGLESHKVIQLFRSVSYLNQDGQLTNQPVSKLTPLHRRPSLVYHRSMHPDDIQAYHTSPGFAWAMRRETWEAIDGLYEYDLGGGGDLTATYGFFGQVEENRISRFNHIILEHMVEWINKAYFVIGGDVGYVDDDIYHLYHGTQNNRQYFMRESKFIEYNLTPDYFEKCENGTFTWSKLAPAGLIQWINEYMLMRRCEDIPDDDPASYRTDPHNYDAPLEE